MTTRALVVAIALTSAACAGGDDPPQDDSALCFAERRAIADALSELALAHAACSIDADCVVAEGGVSCQFECPVAVAVGSKAAYDSARSELDATRCSASSLQWCNVSPACVAPNGPWCVGGQCTPYLLPAPDAGP